MRLRRRRAQQQAFGAEVFVDFRPVDSISAAGDLPMVTLRNCGVQEAGYHVSCTEIERPSIRVTVSESSENFTPATRSSSVMAGDHACRGRQRQS